MISELQLCENGVFMIIRASTCRDAVVATGRPAHGHVPLQIQIDAPGPHVQGFEAFNILPLQHRAGRQGPRLRLLGAWCRLGVNNELELDLVLKMASS